MGLFWSIPAFFVAVLLVPGVTSQIFFDFCWIQLRNRATMSCAFGPPVWIGHATIVAVSTSAIIQTAVLFAIILRATYIIRPGRFVLVLFCLRYLNTYLLLIFDYMYIITEMPLLVNHCPGFRIYWLAYTNLPWLAPGRR
jgi:hypothetical protein